MATIKAVSSGASIGRALDYVTQGEKTEAKLMTGLDCTPEMVKQEMQTTKELWGKTDGRTYMHFVQSWHKDEPISHERAHRIGVELAKQQREEGKPWHGFEVLVATHTDRGHTHNHIIINSVNAEDGKKLQFSPKDLQAMKDRSDELCRKYGLSICEKGKSFYGEDLTLEQPSTYSKEAQYIMEQAKAGKVDSYVMEIAKAAAEVRSTATSREDFCQQMSDRGYAVNWSDTRKNITFTDVAREMHGERKCKVRDSNLEKTFPALQFSKESFILAFEQNAKKELEQDHAAPELAAPGEPQQAEPEQIQAAAVPAPSFDALIAADAEVEKCEAAARGGGMGIVREREVNWDLIALPGKLRAAVSQIEKDLTTKAKVKDEIDRIPAPREPQGIIVSKKKKSQYEAAYAEYREQIRPYWAAIGECESRLEKNLAFVLKEFSPRERQKQGYGYDAPNMTAQNLTSEDVFHIQKTVNFKLDRDIAVAVRSEQRYAARMEELTAARTALKGAQGRFSAELDKIPPEHREKALEAVGAARTQRKEAALAARREERKQQEQTRSRTSGRDR